MTSFFDSPPPQNPNNASILLCILSVSLFSFFINQEDMICYVTACTTQHTENKTKNIKTIQIKLYKAAKGRKQPIIDFSHFFLVGVYP